MSLRPEAEFQAFVDLLTAAAVNQRLQMRILARLENRSLEDLQEEVAALDTELRGHVIAELGGAIRPDERMRRPEVRREEPVDEGALPVGREEERRGHALPNDTEEELPADSVSGAPLGRDQDERVRR
jgi:hypothetical protein